MNETEIGNFSAARILPIFGYPEERNRNKMGEQIGISLGNWLVSNFRKSVKVLF